MSFQDYFKERIIKPIIDSLGIILWCVIYFGGGFLFSTNEWMGFAWVVGYFFVSVLIFFTYWDYSLWKLDRKLSNQKIQEKDT